MISRPTNTQNSHAVVQFSHSTDLQFCLKLFLSSAVVYRQGGSGQCYDQITKRWLRYGFVSVLDVAIAEINDLAVTRRAVYELLVDRKRRFQTGAAEVTNMSSIPNTKQYRKVQLFLK